MICSRLVTDMLSYAQNSLQILMLSLSHLAGESRLAWEFLRDTFTKNVPYNKYINIWGI